MPGALRQLIQSAVQRVLLPPSRRPPTGRGEVRSTYNSKIRATDNNTWTPPNELIRTPVHGESPLGLEQDRAATTFMMPWGRLRYKTYPQGFASAGDTYMDSMDWSRGGLVNVERVTGIHQTSPIPKA